MDITALIIELVQVREVFGDLEVMVALEQTGDEPVTDVIVLPADKQFRRVVKIAALGKRDNA